LESLSKNERAQKAASEKEAREQLAAFRKQQEDAERAALAGGQGNPIQEEGETWAVSARKRKKSKEHDLIKGVKLRKTLSADAAKAEEARAVSEKPKKIEEAVGTKKTGEGQTKSTSPAEHTAKLSQIKASSPPVGLGLGAYSSDEDD
jgi:hypothetical protein